MLGGCCTRPKGSTRMGHGTSPKGRVSTHSCRLPLCHPVCPTVHTYQHVRTHSVDAITGHPPLCSFRPFFSLLLPLYPRDSLSRFVRVCACVCAPTFPLSLSLSPSFLVLCYFMLYFSSLFLFLFLHLILSFSLSPPLSLFLAFATSLFDAFSADPISPPLPSLPALIFRLSYHLTLLLLSFSLNLSFAPSPLDS